MICWHCHWGWPKPIKEIYQRAEREIEELGECGEQALDYGPGHVVWCDENFGLAESCWKDCQDLLHGRLDEKDWRACYKDMPPSVLEIVARSLQELAALPNEYKREPSGYDGEHPENYPPPAHWEMVK